MNHRTLTELSEKNEPKYETLTLGQALDAVAKGEEVEYAAKNPSGDDVWENLLARTPFAATESRDWQFRRLIQPKKKLVPFTQETWPIGAWVRLSNGHILMPTTITKQCANGYWYESLLCHAKLLVIENGRIAGEKPCGLEVEE